MIYYELSDFYAEKLGVNDIENKFKSLNYIKFYAFICHNRTPNVKTHYHCLIQVDLNNKKAKNRIEKDFKDFNPFVKNVRNVKGFARYLQHLDYLDKEKYNDNEVITSNLEVFNDLKKVEIKVSKVEYLLNDLYNYIITTGVAPREIELFKWFLDKGNANYFICHRNAILNFVSRLPVEELYFQELERRLKIENDNIDNYSNYTIDNLF